MAEGDNDLLLRMLEQLRADFAEERESARESRARSHQRVDEVIDRLGKLDTSMALAGEVDAQVRTELDALKASLLTMQPTVDEWRRVRTVGVWAGGLLITGGVGIGAIVAATGDWLAGVIRHWLKIG